MRKLFKAIIKPFKIIQHIVGAVLAAILLTIIYMVAILPTGIVMKILGRDRLKLKKSKADTYWKNTDETDKSYELQF